MSQDNDYHIKDKIKVDFYGMPYWVMPRYRQHYVYNQYEPFSLKIIKNNLNNNSTLLDIGAHYGAYALYAAKNCGSKVIALEPVNENYALLNENVKENKLNNLINTYNVAASSEDGIAEFNIPWASDSAGFYNHPLAETFKKQQVNVVNVDKLVRNKHIDFIKIDTEGHELTVLEGLKDTLKNNPEAKLLVEANPACLEVAGKTVLDLLRVLSEEYNKEVYVVDEANFTLYRLTDQIDNWGDYIAKNGYANIYCVPKEGHQYPLYVCHSNEFGGAELAMVEQIASLRNRGYNAHVVIPYGGKFEELLKDMGIGNSVITYSFWNQADKDNSSSKNQININAAAEIALLAKRIKPTMIINNSMVCPWGLLAAKSQKLPLVWLVHEFGDLDHKLKFNYNATSIRKYIANNSDLVVCCSNAVKDSIIKAEPRGNVHAVYGAIDIHKICHNAEDKLTKNYYSDTNTIKLISVGRVSKSKGQIYAIRAISELLKQGISAELVIVGPIDKLYKKELNQEINKLGIKNRINIVGYKENPHSYVSKSDAVLVCSDNEAFGRVTAEAMILKKIVIGSDSGGTKELISHGNTGLLFKPKNVPDLVEQIKKVQNSEFVTKVTINAHNKILKLLDEESNIDSLIKLIKEIDFKKDRNQEQIIINEIVEAVGQDSQDLNILHKQITEVEIELNNIRAENKELELKNMALIKSKSWQITKPIRATTRIAKSLKTIRINNLFKHS